MYCTSYDLGIGFDNTLGDVKTDRNGQFLIDGDADEFTELNPQLKIYHHCGDNATFSLNPLKVNLESL